MGESMAILENGKGKKGQISRANRAIPEHQDIYQQAGIGIQSCVVHSCRNRGEPFDGAHHRAARAVFEAAGKNIKIKDLRKIWEATK